MKIINLQAENIKRIKAVDNTPAGHLFEVGDDIDVGVVLENGEIK